MSTSEVVLEELVVRFDGTVVEVWLSGRDSERFHVAQIRAIELLRLDDRRGLTLNIETKGRGGAALTHVKVHEHELVALQRIVGEVAAAVRGG